MNTEVVSKIREAIKTLCEKNRLTMERFLEVTGILFEDHISGDDISTTEVYLIAEYFGLDYRALLNGEVKEEVKMSCFNCSSKNNCIGYRLALDLQFLLVQWAQGDDGPKVEDRLTKELYDFIGERCPGFC